MQVDAAQRGQLQKPFSQNLSKREHQYQVGPQSLDPLQELGSLCRYRFVHLDVVLRTKHTDWSGGHLTMAPLWSVRLSATPDQINGRATQQRTESGDRNGPRTEEIHPQHRCGNLVSYVRHTVF